MSSVIDIIKHYQRSIEKYTEDEKRILYCIGKLDALPIKVKHLQETGIGRTVNSLRKYEGQVGHVARTLVAKWKEMVTAESSNSEVEENSDNEQPVDEPNEDSKEYQEKTNESNCQEEEEEEQEQEEEPEDSFKEIEEEEDLSNCQDREVENSYYSSHHKKKKHKSKHDKHDKHEKHEKHSNDSSSDRHSRSDNYHSKQTNHDNSNSSKDKDKVKLQDGDTVDTSSSKHHKEKRKTEDKDEHRKHKKKSHKSDRESSKKSSQHKSSSSSSNSKHSKNISEELKTNFKKEKSTENVDQNKLNKHKKDHSSKHSTSSSYQISDSVSNENISCDEKKSESPVHSSNETKHKSSKNESKKSSHKSSKHKHSKSSHSSQKSVDSSSESTNKNKSEKKHKESKKESSANKRKLVDIDIMANNNLSSDEEGINSFSGTSFADALGGAFETPVKKKLKTVNSDSSSPKTSIKDQPINTSLSKEKYELLSPSTKLPQLNLDINLPEITPNYQPLPSSETLWSITQNKKRDDETLSVAISSKNQRTKVYSGGHRNTLGIVPSLFDLCIRILQDNIDALAYTGGVPYSILYPVLEKASAEQLFTLENYNAYLLEDTDELWEKHCKREFRGHIREELESWREAYSRFLVEREEKLKLLTANIKQSIDKSKLPIRQTKLAYVDSVVKPPRAIARKQAKYGTANVANNKPAITPSSRVAALASSVSNISVPNPGARAATSHNSSTISKPKKAPLMQKTLALIKSTNRYRR